MVALEEDPVLFALLLVFLQHVEVAAADVVIGLGTEVAVARFLVAADLSGCRLVVAVGGRRRGRDRVCVVFDDVGGLDHFVALNKLLLVVHKFILFKSDLLIGHLRFLLYLDYDFDVLEDGFGKLVLGDSELLADTPQDQEMFQGHVGQVCLGEQVPEEHVYFCH